MEDLDESSISCFTRQEKQKAFQDEVEGVIICSYFAQIGALRRDKPIVGI